MTITWRGKQFKFRECDVVGHTREEIEETAKTHGKMQYEPGAVWLVIPGVGYGWEVTT